MRRVLKIKFRCLKLSSTCQPKYNRIRDAAEHWYWTQLQSIIEIAKFLLWWKTRSYIKTIVCTRLRDTVEFFKRSTPTSDYRSYKLTKICISWDIFALLLAALETVSSIITIVVHVPPFICQTAYNMINLLVIVKTKITPISVLSIIRTDANIPVRRCIDRISPDRGIIWKRNSRHYQQCYE
jgi:hypothetical protein